jgi:hypothetical protein
MRSTCLTCCRSWAASHRPYNSTFRTRADMERLGFYVCVADLEEELIRSLGAAGVERVIDAQGELSMFRAFQRQPAWRGRTNEEQLRRFFGTHSSRKIHPRHCSSTRWI